MFYFVYNFIYNVIYNVVYNVYEVEVIIDCEFYFNNEKKLNKLICVYVRGRVILVMWGFNEI